MLNRILLWRWNFNSNCFKFSHKTASSPSSMWVQPHSGMDTSAFLSSAEFKLCRRVLMGNVKILTFRKINLKFLYHFRRMALSGSFSIVPAQRHIILVVGISSAILQKNLLQCEIQYQGLNSKVLPLETFVCSLNCIHRKKGYYRISMMIGWQLALIWT